MPPPGARSPWLAALLGRVSGIYVLAYGARPVGAGLGAAVGAADGTTVALGCAVFLFAVQAVIILASPAARLRSLPMPTSG